MDSLYPITQGGFIAVTVVYVGLLLMLIRRALNATAFSPEKSQKIFYGMLISIVVWLSIISLLAANQVLSDFSTMPPKFLVTVAVPLIVILWATFTRSAGEIVSRIQPQHILYLQSFRVFVEILLWMLFIDNLLPFQMTFEGYNFDILAGITGPLMGLVIQRKKSPLLLLIWNIAGLCLLVNIVTIAILSTPVPFRVFMNEPANRIVTQFPIVWLPGLLVPLAYTLHILSIRQALAAWKSGVVGNLNVNTVKS
jgi:hypothetical protein